VCFLEQRGKRALNPPKAKVLSQSELYLKQDKITASSNLTTGSLTVYTEKLKPSETLDTLIYRLIEQCFSPSYKPTSYAVFKVAVEYFYDNTLGLPEGTNNTQASINNVAIWDVSLITALDCVLSFRNDFNENISNWNVSLVTNMNIAFYECYKFNRPIGNWNVSNVTNIFLAFGRCHSFNQNISGWSVSM
jgi:surface protein